MITKEIPLNEMKVDMSYQRAPDEKRVRKIAREWDDMRANLIHVSHRPDGYYIMDGNHTVKAARIVGRKSLPCRVYEGLTLKDEAEFFSDLNTSQKKPRFAEILKAKAAAGCEPEKGYLNLLDSNGIKYSLTPKGWSGNGCVVSCHSALINVYKQTTPEGMQKALHVTMDAADGREEFYQVGFFPGLCDFVAKHPEANVEHLVNAVKKVTSSQIREIADKNRRGNASGGGNTMTVNYRRAFIEIYNKGLRKNRIKEETEE